MTCCNSNPYGWDSNRSCLFFVEITGVFECCYRNSNETSKTKNLKNGTEKSEKFQIEPLCLIWIGQKTLNHWAFSLWPWSCLISIKYGNNPLKESWFPLHRRLICVVVMRAFFVIETHITVNCWFEFTLRVVLCSIQHLLSSDLKRKIPCIFVYRSESCVPVICWFFILKLILYRGVWMLFHKKEDYTILKEPILSNGFAIFFPWFLCSNVI